LIQAQTQLQELGTLT